MALNFPKGIAAFHVKVYKVVEDPSTDAIISWGKDNNSFVIWNLEELISSKILWRFHCMKFPEFHSELRYYGFQRIKNGSGELEFGNEDFVRGQPERLKNMVMRAMSKNRAKFNAREAVKDLQSLKI
ncbi:unnamed protein product [Arabidopsis lyrata]|uniref:HSF-type DNA-binding domain-containing protein n=1 Tax=Arabidopsis lyrata subsp. lyrata TaxID=81972 RepID=D7MGA2_ARALL|nr:heat stress transcription factor A-1 [Arabidopsis lyrata subsp. lyrata]EFH44190.1 hypothetical protein ARALYDRAFT_914704 [Arabidopsis lyrata subsp. lyrata]CAH8276030.1 unnamed protein product [Arabidopsis lyrata]|eukprot:XP_002867931.1 heat stress transcription factor A-1 [Arabidopsis lyrata subsp. lyrata]